MPLDPDSVHIWREPDGVHHIRWDVSHPDTRVSVQPMAADAGDFTLEQAAGRARLEGLPRQGRQYFRVQDQHGNTVEAPERRLGMEGTPNFRDFGGYATEQGRRVRWGKLFRSGQLSTLTERDLDLMSELDIDLICDFRRLDEQENEPSRLPGKRTPRTASLPITPGSNAAFFEEAGAADFEGRQSMFDFMVRINEDFALAQTETYSRMFAELLAIDDASVLVHCAAGKDRTGFAAAIILLALGVSRDQVMADYLLTQEFFSPDAEIERLKRKYGMEALPCEAVRPMLEVQPDYLAKALDSIDQHYPSLDDYLSDALGVGSAERDELYRRYLD